MAKKDVKGLVEGCRKGELQCQKELYEHFFSYALTIARSYASGDSQAEEVVNDAFMKVFNQIQRYDGKLPFKAWFRRIVINQSIDAIRKEKKHMYQEDANELRSLGDASSILDQMSAEEIVATVQTLPPTYRATFMLYVMEGYKHAEIAEMLGTSASTSKSNLARAREQLKRKLQAQNRMPGD